MNQFKVLLAHMLPVLEAVVVDVIILTQLQDLHMQDGVVQVDLG